MPETITHAKYEAARSHGYAGTASELIRSFGGRPQYLAALQTLERELYA